MNTHRILTVFSIIFILLLLISPSTAFISREPDLAISSIYGPSSAGIGDVVTISVTVVNQGKVSAVFSEVRIYLSPDLTITTEDPCIGKGYLYSVTPGSSKLAGVRCTIPQEHLPGAYHIGALADASSRVSESDEGNNWISGTYRVEIISDPAADPAPRYPTPVPTSTVNPWYPTPKPTTTMIPWYPTPSPTPAAKDLPDLLVIGLDIPDSARSGNTFYASCTVSNVGSAKSRSCDIYLYLSVDEEISTLDSIVGRAYIWSLDAGATKTVAIKATLPLLNADECRYLGVIVDPTGKVPESDETNNAVLSVIAVCRPGPAAPSAMEKAVAQAIVKYTNIEREKAGLSLLTVDEKLADLAMAHSDDMRMNNFFSHDSPNGLTFADRMIQSGYYTAAENIAATMGYFASSANPDEVGEYIVREQWMKSYGHRQNLMREEYRKIGVGVAYEPDTSSSPYGFIATQDFAS
ncbi:MAG TPA: CARDB domain-containing protein [Methanoregulaceae archaeon]|nr:CARDB domain-containing protein [Methanoregulaceae archaeon]